MQTHHQEQRKQFYSVKATQYAHMLKTLDPRNNLPRASHQINRDMKQYSFPTGKPGDPPIPPQKQYLQQVMLQDMIAKAGVREPKFDLETI